MKSNLNNDLILEYYEMERASELWSIIYFALLSVMNFIIFFGFKLNSTLNIFMFSCGVGSYVLMWVGIRGYHHWDNAIKKRMKRK